MCFSCPFNLFSLITTVKNRFYVCCGGKKNNWKISKTLHVCVCGSRTASLLDVTFGICSASRYATEGPCELAGLWQPVSGGKRRTANVPWARATAQTHCWCLQPVKQNEQETQRRMGREVERERENFCTCSECMMGSGAGRLECVSVFVTQSGEVPLFFFCFLLLALEKSVKCCRIWMTIGACTQRPRLRKRPHFVQREFTGRLIWEFRQSASPQGRSCSFATIAVLTQSSSRGYPFFFFPTPCKNTQREDLCTR